jgi:hypothetical protein
MEGEIEETGGSFCEGKPGPIGGIDHALVSQGPLVLPDSRAVGGVECGGEISRGLQMRAAGLGPSDAAVILLCPLGIIEKVGIVLRKLETDTAPIASLKRSAAECGIIPHYLGRGSSRNKSSQITISDRRFPIRG